MEKQLHKILKIIMAVVILVLAYLLPGIGMRKAAEKGTMQREENPAQSESGGKVQEQQGRQEQQETQEQQERQEQQISETGVLESRISNLDATFGSGKTIVIDPGHGGSDPGMVGIGGVEEKEINLQIAQALKGILEKCGFAVILTRADDSGLYDVGTSNRKAQDMQRRCALIEEKRPVLTVSIHQNSYTDPAVYGPQVFYFEHSAEGKELASAIQEQLNVQLEIAKPRVIKANTNYYILKRSESVTVLVECAFLSNPTEVEKIQTAEYQGAVAQAIYGGIMEYLKNVS